MEINVRLFASLKDRAGRSQTTVTLPEPATVQDLLVVLTRLHPDLAQALPITLTAVNLAYVERSAPLHPGDEVALFPPVSGG